MSVDKELRLIFDSFCGFGTRRKCVVEMEGGKFTKLCRDCKLLDGKSVTTTDVDIIFAKVKTKGKRKINFSEFLHALDEVAQKKGVAMQELKQLILTTKGPVANGTKADYNKFHDDKNLYTGVYKRKSQVSDGTDIPSPELHTVLRFDKIFEGH